MSVLLRLVRLTTFLIDAALFLGSTSLLGACIPRASVNQPVDRCEHSQLSVVLPLSATAPAAMVTAGVGDSLHTGVQRYAWDFALPVGSPIVAARDGVVVEVVDGNSEGGPGSEFKYRGNLVWLDHGGGRFTIYGHLRPGIVVREGQTVRRGDVIAYSGQTGQASGPHLHFQGAGIRGESFPLCFEDVGDGVPSLGHRYKGGRSAPQRNGTGDVLMSTLPRDVFPGFELTSDVPAHLLTGAVVLRGRFVEMNYKIDTVIAFLGAIYPGTKKTSFSRARLAADHSFQIQLDTTELPNEEYLLYLDTVPPTHGNLAKGVVVATRN